MATALEAGCGGLVCAVGDVREARLLGPRLTIVTPGIRPVGTPTHDQARAATPQEAFDAGADLLVIGRAVTEAPDPVVAAAELMDWALATAEAIAANSPSAVQAVKRQVSATIADHARTREALEQQLGDAVRASPDFAEGVAAFREKRQPRYE